MKIPNRKVYLSTEESTFLFSARPTTWWQSAEAGDTLQFRSRWSVVKAGHLPKGATQFAHPHQMISGDFFS